MKKSVLIPLTGVVVLAAGLIFALQRPSTAEPPAPGQAWVNENLQEYRQTLAADPSEPQKELLEQKVNQLAYMQEQQQAGAANPAPKNADPCAFLPTAEPQVPAAQVEGIFGDLAAPLSPDDFTLSNAWQGWVGESWVQVFAGVQTADPQQGELWLRVLNSADAAHLSGPAGSGALTILSAQGSRLTLESAAGETLYFDAAARSFLSDPQESLPAVEPQPTFTPTSALCP